MPDRPQSARDLSDIWSARAIHYGHVHREMDYLIEIKNGGVPDEFADYFHDEMHVHKLNFISAAWDDLTNLTAKVFPLRSDPENQTATRKDAAEKREKICTAYNDVSRQRGGPGMNQVMKRLASDIVGLADAVAVVLPDHERRMPFIHTRDPRSHFPPVGWTPWEQEPLDGTMFAYQTTVSELCMRYPDRAEALSQATTKFYSTGARTTGWKGNAKVDDDSRIVWVGEYYSNDYWCVATLEDTGVVLRESQYGDPDHPGVCPVVPFSLFAYDRPKGRSIFMDQGSHQIAMSRILSQEVDYSDQTLYGPVFTDPVLGGNPQTGPGAVNVWDPTHPGQKRVERLSPANTINADRTIQFLIGVGRLLNRNPESFQGGGEADSAKALNALRQGVEGTVRDGFWPSFLEGMPKLYTLAMKTDLALWPHERKKAAGKDGKTPFSITYTPYLDLRGYEESVEIEPGYGLGGYQDHVLLLQEYTAGVMPFDEYLELNPNVSEPRRWRVGVEMDEIKKLQRMQLEQMAGSGILAPDALAKLLKLMAEEGIERSEAIQKLQESGELLAPAPMPAEGAPPPPPSELAAFLGGGQDPIAQGSMDLPEPGQLRAAV